MQAWAGVEAKAVARGDVHLFSLQPQRALHRHHGGLVGPSAFQHAQYISTHTGDAHQRNIAHGGLQQAARRGDHPYGALFGRSEEHTSELQSLMRISYAVFCLKKTKNTLTYNYTYTI